MCRHITTPPQCQTITTPFPLRPRFPACETAHPTKHVTMGRMWAGYDYVAVPGSVVLIFHRA